MYSLKDVFEFIVNGKPEKARSYLYQQRQWLPMADGIAEFPGQYAVYAYRGKEDRIVIPARIGKTPVTCVGIRFSPYSKKTDFWDVEVIVIAEGITRIESDALTIINNLNYLYLPKTVESIEKDSMLYHTQTKIICHRGCEIAIRAAVEHDLQYIIYEDYVDGEGNFTGELKQIPADEKGHAK